MFWRLKKLYFTVLIQGKAQIIVIFEKDEKILLS